MDFNFSEDLYLSFSRFRRIYFANFYTFDNEAVPYCLVSSDETFSIYPLRQLRPYV
jgi:hypothetical protein